MKVAFDTSVLVAGLHRAHPHHARAIVWVDAVAEERMTGLVTWHALAELWSVLTRLPGGARTSPEQALLVVRRVRDVFGAVSIGPAIYEEALQRCAERGLASGVVFDALHLVCAEHAGADALVTFNSSDFMRLTTSTSPSITVPADLPRAP